jgi:Lipase (class 3)/Ricin-type beta-trefoil lectin domain-like
MKSTINFSKTVLLGCIFFSAAAHAQLGNQVILQTPKAGQVLQPFYPARTEKGANVFNTKFVFNAAGRNDMNAYLLSFLSTAVYPDGVLWLESPAKIPAQLDAAQTQLQVDTTAFMAKFRKVVSPYFSTTTRYNGADMQLFAPTGNYDGYDPEAVIIPSAEAIYVIVRGTDRVAQNNNVNSAGYNVGEWLQTDFQALLTSPALPNGKTFVGRVHQGFWLSISKIAERMASRIRDLGGASKKVWITGHSLGAGQAQLFAYYLAKVHGIKAQGVYGFAAPLVGTAEFYRDFESVIGGKEKIQRFEFVDDPITAFALLVPGIATGGTRVHYDYIARENYAALERVRGEVLRICASVPGVVGDRVTIPATGLRLGSLGGMCYHYQHWYMQASYRQLSSAEKNTVPSPLLIPTTAFEGCSSGLDISRAMTENLLGEALLDVTDAVLQMVSDAVTQNISRITSGLRNFTGSALKNGEGRYKIKCLKGGRYLNVDGSCYRSNSCTVMLWGTTASQNNELFTVSKYGLGYGIKVEAPNTNKVLDVEGMSTANNATVKTYDKHLLPVVPNNQIWYFHQIGSTNRYIIQNERSGKVLEADNANTNNAGCSVRQNSYRSGAENQIWVLEKL